MAILGAHGQHFAERTLRGAVIARQFSFGSDSKRGCAVHRGLYSMWKCGLNRIDVLSWRTEWLKAGARGGAGRRPPDLSAWWRPGSMSPRRRPAPDAPAERRGRMRMRMPLPLYGLDFTHAEMARLPRAHRRISRSSRFTYDKPIKAIRLAGLRPPAQGLETSIEPLTP